MCNIVTCLNGRKKMKDILKRKLRKPVPKVSRRWLEARLQAQLNRAEDRDTHSSKVPPPRSDDRDAYAGKPDLAP